MASNSELYGVLTRKSNSCETQDVIKAPFVYRITKNKITIGRFKCDLTIVSTYISRIHAEIKFENNSWTITDKSVNGILLNNQMLSKDEPTILKSDDVIGFGGSNYDLDISYVFKLYLKDENKEAAKPSTSKKLNKNTNVDVIVLDDSEDEGPSDTKRRREISPEREMLLNKNKELEEKMLRLEFELEKKKDDARKEIERQQKEMHIKEQEYELRLKMNAISEKQDLDRIETLCDQLKSAQETKAKLEGDLQQIEADKTKEIALELERAGLEWSLGEKNRLCHKLESQLTEARKKLEEKELELKKAEVPTVIPNTPQSTKISSTVENELQCSICSELFIKATTLSCAHSFCDYCINEWKKTKKECPMCRKAIISAVPSIALDNFISQFTATLSPQLQEKRKEAVEERKALASVPVQNVSKNQSTTNNSGSRRANRQRTNNQAAGTNTHFQVVTEVNVRTRSNTGPTFEVNTSTAIGETITLHDDSDFDSSDDDSSSNDSFISYDEDYEYDSPGSPEPYYGGYGSCYRCGSRQHWANACTR